MLSDFILQLRHAVAYGLELINGVILTVKSSYILLQKTKNTVVSVGLLVSIFLKVKDSYSTLRS